MRQGELQRVSRKKLLTNTWKSLRSKKKRNLEVSSFKILMIVHCYCILNFNRFCMSKRTYMKNFIFRNATSTSNEHLATQVRFISDVS